MTTTTNTLPGAPPGDLGIAPPTQLTVLTPALEILRSQSMRHDAQPKFNRHGLSDLNVSTGLNNAAGLETQKIFPNAALEQTVTYRHSALGTGIDLGISHGSTGTLARTLVHGTLVHEYMTESQETQRNRTSRDYYEDRQTGQASSAHLKNVVTGACSSADTSIFFAAGFIHLMEVAVSAEVCEDVPLAPGHGAWRPRKELVPDIESFVSARGRHIKTSGTVYIPASLPVRAIKTALMVLGGSAPLANNTAPNYNAPPDLTTASNRAQTGSGTRATNVPEGPQPEGYFTTELTPVDRLGEGYHGPRPLNGRATFAGRHTALPSQDREHVVADELQIVGAARCSVPALCSRVVVLIDQAQPTRLTEDALERERARLLIAIRAAEPARTVDEITDDLVAFAYALGADDHFCVGLSAAALAMLPVASTAHGGTIREALRFPGLPNMNTNYALFEDATEAGRVFDAGVQPCDFTGMTGLKYISLWRVMASFVAGAWTVAAPLMPPLTGEGSSQWRKLNAYDMCTTALGELGAHDLSVPAFVSSAAQSSRRAPTLHSVMLNSPHFGLAKLPGFGRPELLDLSAHTSCDRIYPATGSGGITNLSGHGHCTLPKGAHRSGPFQLFMYLLSPEAARGAHITPTRTGHAHSRVADYTRMCPNGTNPGIVAAAAATNAGGMNGIYRSWDCDGLSLNSLPDTGPGNQNISYTLEMNPHATCRERDAFKLAMKALALLCRAEVGAFRFRGEGFSSTPLVAGNIESIVDDVDAYETTAPTLIPKRRLAGRGIIAAPAPIVHFGEAAPEPDAPREDVAQAPQPLNGPPVVPEPPQEGGDDRPDLPPQEIGDI